MIAYISGRKYGTRRGKYHTDRDCPRLRGDVQEIETNKHPHKEVCAYCNGDVEQPETHSTLASDVRAMQNDGLGK